MPGHKDELSPLVLGAPTPVKSYPSKDWSLPRVCVLDLRRNGHFFPRDPLIYKL